MFTMEHGIQCSVNEMLPEIHIEKSVIFSSI